MRRTGLVYDDRYLLHCTGPDHPECAERLEGVYSAIRETGLLSSLTVIGATRPKMKWIEAVHSPRHIHKFEEACLYEMPDYEGADNAICRDTYDTALLAVGGILEAIRHVMEGDLDNAFCAIRPPGHHAESSKALGFCFFNNVAIAARYLIGQWGVERVGIIDIDAHHGNGTQHAFEEDPRVFYYSIHEHPSFAFPGTGRDFERGTGEGEGFTLNTTVLPGFTDEDYRELLARDLFPAFEKFQPQVILLSTGFDAHVDDDMSAISLTDDGYTWIAERIVEMADKYSNGKLISILEGGYSLARLPELVVKHIRILLGG